MEAILELIRRGAPKETIFQAMRNLEADGFTPTSEQLQEFSNALTIAGMPGYNEFMADYRLNTNPMQMEQETKDSLWKRMVGLVAPEWVQEDQRSKLRKLGVGSFGLANAVAFNLLDDLIPKLMGSTSYAGLPEGLGMPEGTQLGMGAREAMRGWQDEYEQTTPEALQLPLEIGAELGLLGATGFMSAPRAVSKAPGLLKRLGRLDPLDIGGDVARGMRANAREVSPFDFSDWDETLNAADEAARAAAEAPTSARVGWGPFRHRQETGLNPGRAGIREAQSPPRTAVGQSFRHTRKQKIKDGMHASDAEIAADDVQREMADVAMARADPESPAAARVAQTVRTDDDLYHPADKGFFDRAKAYRAPWFPVAHSMLRFGRRNRERFQSGSWHRAEPTYEDSVVNASSAMEMFGPNALLKGMAEGSVYGGLEGFGRSDYFSGDSETGIMPAVLGARLGAGIGGPMRFAGGLGSWVGNRIRHFKDRRTTSPQELMAKAIERHTGMSPFLPQRSALQKEIRQLENRIERHGERPFSPLHGNKDNRFMEWLMYDLDRRGAYNIPVAPRYAGPQQTPITVGALNNAMSMIRTEQPDPSVVGPILLAWNRYARAQKAKGVDLSTWDDLGMIPTRPSYVPGSVHGARQQDHAALHQIDQTMPEGQALHDLLQGRPGVTNDILAQARRRYLNTMVDSHIPSERVTFRQVGNLLDDWKDMPNQSHYRKELLRHLSNRGIPNNRGFEQYQDMQRRLESLRAAKVAVQEQAPKDVAAFDSPELWGDAMDRWTNHPEAQAAYGQAFFEQLVKRLTMKGDTARKTFLDIAGGDPQSRANLIQVIQGSPALAHMTPLQKQNLINEIHLIANTELSLSETGVGVVDSILRMLAGVSTDWAVWSGVRRGVGVGSGGGFSGKGSTR